MDDISQQTDESSESEIEPWCTRIWPYIWPFILSFIFIALALLFALIYMGVGTHDRYVHFPQPKKEKKSSSNVLDVKTHKYPFIGALTSDKPYLFLCTVVILTNRYLLTEAHCFTTNFPNLLVKVGSHMWSSEGRQYKVQYFIIHEEYNGISMENDIGLIKVKENIIMGKSVSMVKVETTPVVKVEYGIVLGWIRWPMADRGHVRLVEQKLLIWKPERCRKYVGNETSSKFICASLNNTLCNLDVTGPLLVDGKLVGVWSWGLSCLEVPSVFTNFHYFMSWIWTELRR